MKVLIFILMSVAFGTRALAAGGVEARVIEVRADKDGRGMVMFDQQVGGTPPACVHSAYTNAFSFDATSGGGKAIMAMALAAKASGSLVSAHGAGTCSIYSGAWVEDMSYGVIR